jgi:hypothetical protein
MIYNEDLTIDLVNVFGKEVLEWSENKIRVELDKKVDSARDSLLLSKEDTDKTLVCTRFLNYAKIKDIDNEFTEKYIEQLETN